MLGAVAPARWAGRGGAGVWATRGAGPAGLPSVYRVALCLLKIGCRFNQEIGGNCRLKSHVRQQFSGYQGRAFERPQAEVIQYI